MSCFKQIVGSSLFRAQSTWCSPI